MNTGFQLAGRFAGVTTSPVRDILAVVNRGDVISFAGGIPDASLFEVDDFRAAYDHVPIRVGARCSTPRPRVNRSCSSRLRPG